MAAPTLPYSLNGSGPASLLLAPDGSPLRDFTRRRGRPRNDERIDLSREYTVGGTSSPFANIYTANALTRLAGDVDDLDLRLGRQAKDEMDKDPYCAAALDTIWLGATARPLEIEPASEASFQSDDDRERAEEVAALHRRGLGYIRETQRDLKLTAFQVGRTATKIGHSKSEIVSGLRRGGADDLKRVVTRIVSKTRQVSCFVTNPQGQVVGIAAYTGALADYKDPYKASSTRLTGYMAYGELGAGWEFFPRDPDRPEENKWLVVTNAPGEDNSPLGTSLYRRVHMAWRCKRDMWPMYLKGLDNTAMPHVVAKNPPREYSEDVYPLGPDGKPDRAAEKVPVSYAIFQALEMGRQGGISVLPYLTEVVQLYTAQSGDPFMVARNVWNSEITQGILLQSLATGTDRHMARSAGEVHQDVLQMAFRYHRTVIEGALYRDISVPFTRWNFPKEYWHLAPRYSFGDVELNDFAAWARAFKDLADAGLLLPSQFPHVWAILGLPQGKLSELWEVIAEDQALMEQLSQPQVNPTTGAVEPAQQATYIMQELGKLITRNSSRRKAGQLGGTGF